ncbi:MAG: DUF58 domain-containing protein [Desulfosalsimonadaceae bacterium]
MKKTASAARHDTLLPAGLDRKKIFILPTRHGMLFLLVLLGMLLGSINYNNNLGFLLVFLLGSMALVSVIHTWRNLLGLEVLSVSADPVFAGQTAVFSLHVRSGRFARRAVTFGWKKMPRLLENMAAEQTRRLELPSARPERGIHRPGRLLVATRYPLGLFRAWSSLDTGAACIVYPWLLDGAFSGKEQALAADSGEDSVHAGVDDFQGLRSYQPGDAIRHIAWKALSRGQGVFTKEFGADALHTVVLDYSAMPGGDTEEKLSRLAGMVIKADLIHAAYGLKLPGAYLPPDKGEKHRHACLKALALFDAAKGAVHERAG